MKERNTSNWDTMDFQDWVVRNIHMLLSGKQLDLFIKNNFGYDDLKFFGILTMSFFVVTRIDLFLFAISAKYSRSSSLYI